MFSNYFFLVMVTTFVMVSGMPNPVTKKTESTTIKVLVPPPPSSSSFDDGDDDAVIIDADDTSPPVDHTPSDFNSSSDCFLPTEKGPCKAILEAWTYNPNTSSCEMFNYSGCGGNNNRFSELEYCNRHCTNVLKVNKPTKLAENKACPKFDGCGPLKCGVSTDPNTGCKQCDCNLGNDAVIVGSVSGNPDNPNQQSHHTVGTTAPTSSLKTKSDELNKKPEEVCKLPETRGNCRAMMTRWRYSPELKECIQFHYGGCDANSNNFVSNEKCIELCRGQ